MMSENWEDAALRAALANEPSENGHAAKYKSARANRRTKTQPNRDHSAGSGGKKSIATVLVELATNAGVKLYHTREQAVFARIPAGNHYEVYPVRSSAFRRWLNRLYFSANKKSPNTQAVQEAVGTLEGTGHFDAPQRDVFVRLGEHDGRHYVDVGDEAWSVIEISSAGWEVLKESPVLFRRPRGLLPLPLPTRSGSVEELREFINVKRDDDFVLIVAWLVAALRPCGPFPVLCLLGEAGAAKSTAARILRGLIDPNLAPLRSPPKEARDLVLAASNSAVVGLDNLSSVPPWLSDLLCCISTGVGYSTRKLYEDDEETIFAATRPVIITAIENVLCRGDLLDRSITVGLDSIPEKNRVAERVLRNRFEVAAPSIFGALLTALSGAMRELPNVDLPQAPRMADFAEFGVAVEMALKWKAGTFLTAYSANRADANQHALEADPLTPFVVKLADAMGSWTGTANALLKELRQIAGDDWGPKDRMPSDARSLSGRLKRLAPNLREVRVEVSFWREAGGKRSRMIGVKSEQSPDFASPSSHVSPCPENTRNSSMNSYGTQNETTKAPSSPSDPSIVPPGTQNPAAGTMRDDATNTHRPTKSSGKTSENDASGKMRDDRDAKSPHLSEPTSTPTEENKTWIAENADPRAIKGNPFTDPSSIV
jgi:hypothetical protein